MRLITRSRLRLLLAITAALALGAFSAANAAIITYVANLDGPSESPPNASPGTGATQVDYDNVAHTLHVHVTFSGLLGTTTASHIHAPTTTAGTGTAGVATTTPTFAGFPLGVTSGTYDNTLDLTLATSYNPSYVTANGGTPATAEAALTTAIAAGKAYLNIHSQLFPGGEIRGFLVEASTPARRNSWGRLKSMYLSSQMTAPLELVPVIALTAMGGNAASSHHCCE
jgi:hypothetical protein